MCWCYIEFINVLLCEIISGTFFTRNFQNLHGNHGNMTGDATISIVGKHFSRHRRLSLSQFAPPAKTLDKV